jgi:hypothetical protein
MLAPLFPISSRWALRWYSVGVALLLPMCLLALSEYLLNRRR